MKKIKLRDTGITNMYSATSYLIASFGLNKEKAGEILKYWIETFEERHPG